MTRTSEQLNELHKSLNKTNHQVAEILTKVAETSAISHAENITNSILSSAALAIISELGIIRAELKFARENPYHAT